MTKIFYDTEFIDDGRTIELISIGMVSDKGEEYYAINEDLSLERLGCLDWHIENTVPNLPIYPRTNGKLEWDDSHADGNLIKPRAAIRDDIQRFLIRTAEKEIGPVVDEIELWAWYGAYDHVALAQLWGPMVDLPKGIVPMYTNDLKQDLTRIEKTTGNKRLRFDIPKMSDGKVHNALDDARLLKTRYEWLQKYAVQS